MCVLLAVQNSTGGSINGNTSTTCTTLSRGDASLKDSKASRKTSRQVSCNKCGKIVKSEIALAAHMTDKHAAAKEPSSAQAMSNKSLNSGAQSKALSTLDCISVSTNSKTSQKVVCNPSDTPQPRSATRTCSGLNKGMLWVTTLIPLPAIALTKWRYPTV